MQLSANKHNISGILKQKLLSKENIIVLLSANKAESKLIFNEANKIKKKYVEHLVYYRGLVEFSNVCKKDCLYCGIRKSNKRINRYTLSDKEILNSVKFASYEKYGSVILQSGEVSNNKNTLRISNLLTAIKKIGKEPLGITLSCGEQSEETYQKWFNNGSHRYLLRIETSNKELYKKLHPENDNHDYNKRLNSLKTLKKIGYQTGTGVMIGLPFQTIEDLADDLLFMKKIDIDMCGMGPFIPHKETPLYKYREQLWSTKKRLELTLKMIAILRIMMKDINIAATTALQTIDPLGREKGILAGANVVMPNITPTICRSDYALYEGKPCMDDNASDCKSCLEARIHMTNNSVAYGKWGDSLHYFNRIKSS